MVLSPRFRDLDDALSQAGSLDGAIVVDTVNPYRPDFSIALPETTTVAAHLNAKIPGARLAKAFNTLFSQALEPGVRHDPH